MFLRPFGAPFFFRGAQSHAPIRGTRPEPGHVAAAVGAPRVVAWNLRALLHEKTRMLPRGRIAYF
ncbi:hypothetical protein GCM10009758_04250 [Microbacterium hatanonis]